MTIFHSRHVFFFDLGQACTTMPLLEIFLLRSVYSKLFLYSHQSRGYQFTEAKTKIQTWSFPQSSFYPSQETRLHHSVLLLAPGCGDRRKPLEAFTFMLPIFMHELFQEKRGCWTFYLRKNISHFFLSTGVGFPKNVGNHCKGAFLILSLS